MGVQQVGNGNLVLGIVKGYRNSEKKYFKGTLPQIIFSLKSGHIGHLNSLNIGCLVLYYFYVILAEMDILAIFFLPETMSPLYVQS